MTVPHGIFNYLSKYYNFRFGIDGVAINGGHTHQGCTDAIGSICVNPP
jgi:hypothetical protein